MAELTYFSVISRVDGSSGKRRITIHPKIEGGRRSTDVHQVNEGGPPDTGDGAIVAVLAVAWICALLLPNATWAGASFCCLAAHRSAFHQRDESTTPLSSR